MEYESKNPILETVNLEFAYQLEDGRVNKVLDGINLKVPAGQFVAVLGRNGSGKSTLAKNFNAVLLPTGGKAYALGIDTSDEEHVYDIRQNVGMVFQNPDNQIVATIVEEDVAFGLENLGVPPEEIRRRVDNALKDVGMYEYRNHAPHQLSGGQKQRVAIAGIIAMKPKCIVLDEPTAMLDPRGRKEVIDTVIKLNKQEGITIVLITHFMDEAIRADRVAVIEHGGIILDGEPHSVFSNVALLKSVGLDVPQAAELVFELEKSGAKLPSNVLTVDECVSALSRLLEESHCRKIR